MIFPKLEIEPIVQVNDKTRLSAVKSFADKSESAITKVEIDPDGSTGFIDVTGASSSDWYLDWQYSTDLGSPFSVSVRVTTAGAPVTYTKTITVLTEANDYLFSKDSDLVAFEPDILNYIPDGHSSFNFIHRRAQQLILDELDNMGLVDKNGNRFVAKDLIDVQEVKEWSVFKVLKIIFQGLSERVDDEFDQKMKQYESLEAGRKDRARLRIDFDKDGILDKFEEFEFSSIDVSRG